MGWLSGVVSSVGGLLGSALDSHNDRELARMNAGFQREVYQNQYQWKAADARKAGLHPLAVLGGGSYSASPVSSGSSSNYAGVLGKLGEGIGDAFTAYMTKDELAVEKAIADIRSQKQFNASMAESEAKTNMYNAQAQESLSRARQYTIPMASGREFIKGQVDSNGKHVDSGRNKFQTLNNPDGTPSRYMPSGPYKEAFEDTPAEMIPLIDAYLSYDDPNQGFLDAISKLDNSQLDDLLEHLSKLSPSYGS